MYRSQETVKNNTNPPAATDASDDFYWGGKFIALSFAKGRSGKNNWRVAYLLSPALPVDSTSTLFTDNLTTLNVFQVTSWNMFLL